MTQNRNLSILADNVSSAGVLGVSGGGTGLATTPANGQLNIGNGTGFTRATLSAGTGISITNGAGSISIATTGAGVATDRQVFNASGTWTKPASGTYAVIQIWGSGGGGGWYASGIGAGGGGGYSCTTCLLSDLSATVSVTVGAGGTAGSGNGVSGGNGGSITFGSYLTHLGGLGGSRYFAGCSYTAISGVSGRLSATSGLTLIAASQEVSGLWSYVDSGSTSKNYQFYAPASGALSTGQTVTSVFGGNGGAATTGAGGAGTAPGGGGGASLAGSSNSGGAGAIGRVVVTVF